MGIAGASQGMVGLALKPRKASACRSNVFGDHRVTQVVFVLSGGGDRLG